MLGLEKKRGWSASASDTRPPPTKVGPATESSPVSAGLPVVTSADLSSATDQVGWRCLSRAAAPATWGLAMLVPESDDHAPPGTDERMSTPGAATSGFSCSESAVGPTEEKSAWIALVGAPWTSTAATAIAASADAGEETDPAPTSLNSFPAATTGTTPAAAAASSACVTTFRLGSISGSPSERLMTSIPSRTAASIAATSPAAFSIGLAPPESLLTRAL